MAQSLVIVESPAKARTINRYLGKDYIVKSSVGHIRDLPVGSNKRGNAAETKARARKSKGDEVAKVRKVSPEERAAQRKAKARRQLVRRMGVDPHDEWRAEYEVLPGKEKVVSELSRLARKADMVYLATDLDREGEAIAWHLRETIGGAPERYRRVVFNEITRGAIQEAFRSPSEIDMNRVNAQQARRFLDRVVGFELSPLLWSKVARGLSAGRVQSVAVRLLVEREREIRAFDPKEYWELFADLQRQGEQTPLRLQVIKDGGKGFRPGDEATAQKALGRLRQADFAVSSRTDRPTKTRPSPPFITSTLQQGASGRLGFGVKKTMTLAQRLYEGGYITYMRTDSTSLSGEAVAACRQHISEQFGDTYLPDRPRFYASKATAQEAHEAIRPSNVTLAPEQLAGVSKDAARLYDLIRRQFIACQMPDAKYLATTVLVGAGTFELRIRGRIQLFDGYTKVMSSTSRSEEDRPLPDLAVGEKLALMDAKAVQHFTKPPPRYSEASLVRELEKRGIGRPSTYVAIISTIQERGYVSILNRRFHAEKIGELVTDRLREQFEDLMDYGFTAKLEQELDQVSSGEVRWQAVLDDFYGAFSEKLAIAHGVEGGMRPNAPTDTDIPCPTCGRPMQIRTAASGVFLGCSGYQLPRAERCTATINPMAGEEAIDVDQDDEGESKLLRAMRKCPVCATPMTSYLLDEARKLHICGDNPNCVGFAVELGQFRIKGYDGPVLECDRCGKQMQLKTGRFGKYFGCTACKNTRKLLRNGQPAPPKADPVPMPELRCRGVDDHYLLRDGAAGIFLAASKFPKNRETRPPLVSELLPHANEVDPKFKYLLLAPVADPDGVPTVIRYSRKTKQQFVASETEGGERTGWAAYYKDGEWVASAAAPQSGASAKKGRAGKGASRRRKKGAAPKRPTRRAGTKAAVKQND